VGEEKNPLKKEKKSPRPALRSFRPNARRPRRGGGEPEKKRGGKEGMTMARRPVPSQRAPVKDAHGHRQGGGGENPREKKKGKKGKEKSPASVRPLLALPLSRQQRGRKGGKKKKKLQRGTGQPRDWSITRPGVRRPQREEEEKKKSPTGKKKKKGEGNRERGAILSSPGLVL